MPFILESIVATKNADGSFHVRPYGLHQDDDDWLLKPFRPSAAIENLQRHPFAVISSPSDMRVIAGLLTGRASPELTPTSHVDGMRLTHCYGHIECEAVDFIDHEQRPTFRLKTRHQASHRPFTGFNRAQAAVLEAAILSTRLHLLPREKIEQEWAYLRISIDKCAGPMEREAFEWIEEKVFPQV